MCVQAIASVLLENNCISADKATYCTECQQHETGHEDWEVCLEECAGEADAEAQAFAEAVASITLTNTEYCRTHKRWGSTTTSGSTSVRAPLWRRLLCCLWVFLQQDAIDFSSATGLAWLCGACG